MLKMGDKIAKNFTVRELCGNKEENVPHNLHLVNAVRVANSLLQSIRDKFGIVLVTSFYRNKAYNKKIGGSNNSQHTTGEAIDIIPNQADILNVFIWIKHNLEFDQLILEEKNGTRWIHVSQKIKNNRKQAMIAKYNLKTKLMEYREVL
jgi:hypothetical protein